MQDLKKKKYIGINFPSQISGTKHGGVSLSPKEATFGGIHNKFKQCAKTTIHIPSSMHVFIKFVVGMFQAQFFTSSLRMLITIMTSSLIVQE